MTAVTDLPADRRTLSRRPDMAIVLAMALAATALTLLLNAGTITETMRGVVGDPDDAMRLVEVRNWLAGQSWFDMTAARLDPPHGSVLHWSRLVDLPVAAMIRVFSLFAAPLSAERLAAVAVPSLWLLALYLGMMRLGALLVGPGARVPALIGTFLSGATLVQFAPGRIGHHAPETVALVLAVGSAVAALDGRCVRQAFVCGLLVALSLAMSLETFPFLVVLSGVILGLWFWDGADAARRLGLFAAGLVVGLPSLFLLTVGPDHWLAPTCDAYGAAHLGAGLIGAFGALALAAATSRLTTRWHRLAASAIVGAAIIAFVGVAYPACLHSPFAGVDPLVRGLWLDRVVESLPLPAFMRTRPMVGIAIFAPVLLGCGAALAAAAKRRDVAARRFLLVAMISLAGVGLAFWQVRTIASVTPIALCGGFAAVHALRSRAGRLAPVAILAFCSTAWLLVLPSDARTAAEAQAARAKLACLSPDALAPLVALPPGPAVAPIDSGSHILSSTPLSVFAAPYHRNDDGNRFAYEVFLAPPAAADALLAARHVAYVMTCPAAGDLQRLAAHAPDGLAAKLVSDEVPSFLVRQDLAGTPYRVYRVRGDK